MKICEIWEDLVHPDNAYIFKYDRIVTQEEHAELLKKILGSDVTIPYLMHKELDIPISDCQKAYDAAIDYLRSQGKLRGVHIMADAKKCDICGKMYETPICNDAVRIRVDFGYEGDRYVDLCEVCYNRLCNFVKPTLPKYASVERKKAR